MRREYLTPGLITMYREPIMLVEGRMQYLFDETGRRYLDALGGIVTVSVGHCHPKVLEAVHEQNDRLQHATTIYLHPNVAELGKRLAATFPRDSGLSVCTFVNSGSEANDLAILMARVYTGNTDVIALRNSYHGGSQGAMGLTGHSTWKFNVMQGYGVQHAVVPDTYRGPWRTDDPRAAERYADDVLDLIRRGTPGRIAAYIAESIQGVGGVVEPPDGYLRRVYEHVRAAGGLCIADEVQSGFGRTGSAYWGFENHGVTPDIVTMAKGIGNGAPLAACVTRPEIAKVLAERIHFNTFGGNPVSCAQGIATLRIIEEEGIQSRAALLGARLLDGLRRLQERHALIGDVRGRGLMIGVELIDPASGEGDHDLADAVMEEAFRKGLLVLTCGHSTIRFCPPLTLTVEQAEEAVERFALALEACVAK